MAEKLDKLGRRIPKFDRSKAMKKGAQTTKEKHGQDFHAQSGTAGGKSRTRGYFGTLKDQGRTAELKTIATQGGKALTFEQRSAASIKGWETKHSKPKRRRHSVHGDTEGSA